MREAAEEESEENQYHASARIGVYVSASETGRISVKVESRKGEFRWRYQHHDDDFGMCVRVACINGVPTQRVKSICALFRRSISPELLSARCVACKVYTEEW